MTPQVRNREHLMGLTWNDADRSKDAENGNFHALFSAKALASAAAAGAVALLEHPEDLGRTHTGVCQPASGSWTT